MLLKTITHCARCGENHANVEAKPLTRPMLVEEPSVRQLYTHWATCPTNGEPFFVVEVPTEGDKASVSVKSESIPPPVDRRAVTTLHGSPVGELKARQAKQKTGMHDDYIVLTAEERKKGFVRPVRMAYTHLKCGASTRMNSALAETYARDPSFYGATYCTTCGTHYPVGEKGEFVWEGTDIKVGT